MPLTSAQIERAQAALDGPFSFLRIDPHLCDVGLADARATLADYLQDHLSVLGSCCEAQTRSGIDPKALARLIWMQGHWFALYRALVEQRP